MFSRSIHGGIGFQPVALKITGWKPIPRQNSDGTEMARRWLGDGWEMAGMNDRSGRVSFALGREFVSSVWLSAAIYFMLLPWVHSAVLVAQNQNQNEVELLKQKVFSSINADESQDFRRKGLPQRGDWLAQFPEAGQSLELYKTKDSRILTTPKRRRIVLQPLGEFSVEQKLLLEALREYAQVYFQMDVRIASSIRLLSPEKSRLGRSLPEDVGTNRTARQYDAMKLVNELLLKKLPDDAAVYLGITMEDLYAKDMNYVFGYGSFDQRTGVYSLARYFPEFWNEPSDERSKTVALRRAFKVLNHETSHVFGLKHCIFYDCTMNGGNSLEEADATSMHECPVCHQKLRWNLKFDPVFRFKSLKTIYQKHGLNEEAAWMAKRIENWQLANRQDRAK